MGSGVGVWARVGVLSALLAAPCLAGDPLSYADFQAIVAGQNASLDLIQLPATPEEIQADAERILKETRDEVEAIAKRPAHDASFTNTVLALDHTSYELGMMINRFSALVQLESNTPRGEEANTQLTRLNRLLTDIYLRADILARITAFKGMKDLESEEERLVEVLIENFVVASKRTRKVVDGWENDGIQTGLDEQTTQFNKNIYVREPVKLKLAELAGVPTESLARYRREGAYYVVDTSQWDQWDPIIRLADSVETRKRVWLSANTGAPAENETVAGLILAGRERLARKQGFKSWAERETYTMSATPSSLLRQFAEFRRESEKAFLAEKREMKRRLGREPERWDEAYVREQMHRELGLTAAAMEPYFEFEGVLSRLLGWSESAFELEIRLVEDAPVWKGGRFYAVLDKNDGRVLGGFVIDPFARPGKEPWFMCSALTTSESLPGGHHKLASSLLHTTYAPPAPGSKRLLVHDEIVTIAHELGHVLHEILPNQKFFYLSPEGSNSDLVEYPAMLMERVVSEPEVLRELGRHYETDAPIPEDLVQAIYKSRKNLSVHYMRRRVAEAVLDLKMHGAKAPKLATLEPRILGEYHYALPAGLLITPSSRWLIDYGALGWSYLLADGLADATVREMRSQPGGLAAPGAGMKFRRNFQEAGSRFTSKELIKKNVSSFNLCASLLQAAEIEN